MVGHLISESHEWIGCNFCIVVVVASLIHLFDDVMDSDDSYSWSFFSNRT